MDRRLAVTLGVAALAHAMVWRVVHAPSRFVDGPRVAPDSLALDLQVIEPLEPTVEPAAPMPAPAAAAAPAKHGSAMVAPKVSVPMGASSDTVAVITSPSADSSADSNAAAAPKPKFPSLIDLDSPGSHAVIFPSTKTSDSAEPTKEVATAKKLDAQLKGMLDAKDTEVGSGFGGPVVSAAHSAAGSSGVLGWATFDVSTDSFGTVTTVKLVDFGGDAKQWQGVAKDLGASMQGRKLKVPTGAAGVAVRVKVDASMRLPSGATKGIEPSIGAGTVGGTFDVADIGQKPKRMVAVRIVSESRI